LEPIHTLIEFQMSLLLFVALAGYLLASRINQSAVVGEILVGVLVGPSVLGWVTYTDFVGSIAHLGAVFLLFVVGLEFRLEDIARPRYFVIAVCGVVIPWVGGYAVAAAFGFPFATSVFVGTALTATSIAITANVLKEMGKLKTAAAQAIIGAAVIDDILGLLALAVGNGIASGTFSAAALGGVLAKSLAFLVGGAVLGHLVLRPLLSVIDRTTFTRRYPEVTFIFATMVAFFYGMAAESLGLSAIVGAFIAGASLGGLELENGKSLDEGSEYVQIIFASVFFVSLGVLADVSALQGRVLLFLGVLTVVALATKLVGCGLPALLYGNSVREAAIIGFGMAPRGEVAMIIALVAQEAGVIGQDGYVVIILMSLLTTIVTPMALRGLFARQPA
jgi:Kef-type K+ transport system membrane component KefB